MAYVALENSEVSALTREDFTVIANEETGRYTLVIPRIAVELSCEAYCDGLAGWILEDIDISEKLDV